MRPTQTVYRIEALAETAVPFPSLAEAMAMNPRTPEACIATSLHGVHLADAAEAGGRGGLLYWAVTIAGQNVIDATGWTAGQPDMSARDSETVLATALREDFEAVA